MSRYRPTPTKGALLRAFAGVAPPTEITQDAYDSDRGHLRRLVRLRRENLADRHDLWCYAHDVLYTEIQSDLLRYLLPFCLDAWRHDLRDLDYEYDGFVEYFYPMLAHRRIFEEHLTAKQADAVSAFLRQSILEEMDTRRGLAFSTNRVRPSPHSMIGALTTYGVLRPDIERLWTAWWSVDSPGRAVTALQYVSCLIYADENPVFAPWTCRGCGGAPCLWDFVGALYSHRWLEPNVEFLRRTLTVPAIVDVVERAMQRLTGEAEYSVAQRIRTDLPLQMVRLESRCLELPQRLAIPRDLDILPFDWTL